MANPSSTRLVPFAVGGGGGVHDTYALLVRPSIPSNRYRWLQWIAALRPLRPGLPQLRQLRLLHCSSVDSAAVKALCQFVALAPTMFTLEMNGCDWTDADVRLFANTLRSNTSLGILEVKIEVRAKVQLRAAKANIVRSLEAHPKLERLSLEITPTKASEQTRSTLPPPEVSKAEIGDSLQRQLQSPFSRLRVLVLGLEGKDTGAGLTDDDGLALFSALRSNRTLVQLRIEGSGFSSKTVPSLATVLEENHIITSIYLAPTFFSWSDLVTLISALGRAGPKSGLQELDIWSLDVTATQADIDESAADSVENTLSEGDIEAARKLIYPFADTVVAPVWHKTFDVVGSSMVSSQLQTAVDKIRRRVASRILVSGRAFAMAIMNRVSAGSPPLTPDLALLVLDTIVADELLAGADSLHASGLPLVFGMPASAALADQHRRRRRSFQVFAKTHIREMTTAVTSRGSIGRLVPAKDPWCVDCSTASVYVFVARCHEFFIKNAT
ncbi:hypothetical protein HK405_010042, partial [Cladochytrium tenue]